MPLYTIVIETVVEAKHEEHALTVLKKNLDSISESSGEELSITEVHTKDDLPDPAWLDCRAWGDEKNPVFIKEKLVCPTCGRRG